MRGESLGHHQAAEQVERFSQWRSDQMATLIWGLGAMAAERVFYGQTTSGVGGDIQTVTRLAALMVGAAGMGPEPLDLDAGLDAKEEDRVLARFEDIGLKLMNRTGSIQDHDVAASVLSDRDKRRLAAQIVGQAYVRRTTSSRRTVRGSRRSPTRSSHGARSTATSWSSSCRTPSSSPRRSTYSRRPRGRCCREERCLPSTSWSTTGGCGSDCWSLIGPRSLHRHRFREVARLIDVGAHRDRRVIGDELHRDGIDQRRHGRRHRRAASA